MVSTGNKYNFKAMTLVDLKRLNHLGLDNYIARNDEVQRRFEKFIKNLVRYTKRYKRNVGGRGK